MNEASTLFTTVASDYARFRPRYPAELYQWIQQLCPSLSCVWDVGCGNGQASVALAQIAQQVIATDLSAEQLAQAEKHSRVHYCVAPAEAAPLCSHSVDVITVAQALHWFDLSQFNPEVRRVLRNNGYLFAWTYQPIAARDDRIQAVLDWFYQTEAKPWWPAGREHVDNGYRQLVLPFEQAEPKIFVMEQSFQLDELLGYVATWSAVARRRRATGQDPVSLLAEKLRAVWPAHQESLLYWPLTVRFCRAVH